ncbi:MAG: hypothetical protein NEHIOOID_00635 [Holosporales bacterium]
MNFCKKNHHNRFMYSKKCFPNASAIRIALGSENDAFKFVYIKNNNYVNREKIQ